MIFTKDGQYRFADFMFNDYNMGWIRKSEEKRNEEKLKTFPHLSGKKEHTVVLFNREKNEYINSKILGRDEIRKKEEKVDIWNPYIAPEALKMQVSVLFFTEEAQKADSFSIGVILLLRI